jgi:threonine/homoserine/homoserine lactone efflux protein
MEPNLLIYLIIALAATTVGAVPLGLVNLSVLDSALKNDSKGATQIAHGASVVEVFFTLASVLMGAKLSLFFEGNPVVRYFVFAVLLVSGVFFWFKTNKEKIRTETQKSFGFLKGVLLNIVSVQVLLFWLLAATVLSAKQWLPTELAEVLLFLAGVWLAKMGVLKGYAFLAKIVATHAEKFSANTNRIISIVLLAVSIIQFVKI